MVKEPAITLLVVIGLIGLGGCGDGHDHGTQNHGEGAVKAHETSAAPLDPNAKPYPLKTCIVSGEELGKMGEPMVFTYKGQEIKLCCKGCEKTFMADPEKHLAKIAAAAPK